MSKWNGTKRNRTEPFRETATESAPRPGDYPIGSLQSRAAARALMQKKEKNEEEQFIQIIYVSPDGTQHDGPRLKIGMPL